MYVVTRNVILLGCIMKTISKEPPLVLVKTWHHLLTNSEDKKVKNHARNMLMGAFDNNQQAILLFMKRYNLI